MGYAGYQYIKDKPEPELRGMLKNAMFLASPNEEKIDPYVMDLDLPVLTWPDWEPMNSADIKSPLDVPTYIYEHFLDFCRNRKDDFYYLITNAKREAARNPAIYEQSWADRNPLVYYSPYYEAIYRGWYSNLSTRLSIKDGIPHWDYRPYIELRKNPQVYMDISIGDEKPRRVVIELKGDVAPVTTANFLGLCEGFMNRHLYMSYNHTHVHRVDKGYAFFGGDVLGQGGEGYYGFVERQFKNECFDVKHDAPGIVSMDNRGSANHSHFLITQRPLPELDGKYVAFGKVVEGLEVVADVDRVEIDRFGHPTRPVKIVRSGILMLKPEDDPYLEFRQAVRGFQGRGFEPTPSVQELYGNK